MGRTQRGCTSTETGSCFVMHQQRDGGNVFSGQSILSRGQTKEANSPKLPVTRTTKRTKAEQSSSYCLLDHSPSPWQRRGEPRRGREKTSGLPRGTAPHLMWLMEKPCQEYFQWQELTARALGKDPRRVFLCTDVTRTRTIAHLWRYSAWITGQAQRAPEQEQVGSTTPGLAEL